MQYNESVNQQQARYSSELAALREQLQEADGHRGLLEREVITFELFSKYCGFKRDLLLTGASGTMKSPIRVCCKAEECEDRKEMWKRKKMGKKKVGLPGYSDLILNSSLSQW